MDISRAAATAPPPIGRLKAIVVAAPTGFGKHRFIRQYAEQCERLEVRRCEQGQRTADLLRQVRSIAAGSASHVRWMLLFEGAEVLDDGVLAEFLTQAIPQMQGGVVAITTSRAPAPEVLSAFPVGDIAVFLRSDIALTMRRIALVPEFIGLDASVLFRSAALTSGWSAPMRIIARRMSGHEDSIDMFDIHNEMWREVFDWLTNRVIDPLPADIRYALIAATTFGDLCVEDFGDFDGQHSRIASLLCREYQLADVDNGTIHVLPILALCVFNRYGAAVKETAESIVGAVDSFHGELRDVRSCITTGKFADAESILREKHVLHLSEYAYPGLILEYMQRSTFNLSAYPKLWLGLLPSRRIFCPPYQLLEEARSAIASAPRSRMLRTFLQATIALLYAETQQIDRARENVEALRKERGAKLFGESVALFIALERESWDEALGHYLNVRSVISRYPAWFRFLHRAIARAEAQRALGGEPSLSKPHGAIAGQTVTADYADASETVDAFVIAWLHGDEDASNIAKSGLLQQLYRGASPMHWRIAAAVEGIDLRTTKWASHRDQALSAMFLAEHASTPEDRRRYLQHAVAIAEGASLDRIQMTATLALAAADPERSTALMEIATTLAENKGFTSLQPEVVEKAAGTRGELSGTIDVLARRFAYSNQSERESAEDLFVDIVRGTISCGRGERLRVSTGTLALIVLLVTEGGALRRERAIDLLWPDLDGEAGTNALKAALHRARRQLGVLSGIQLRDGVLSLGPSVRSNFQKLTALAVAGDPLRDAHIMATILHAVAEETWEWASWEWFGERAERIRMAARKIGLALAAAQSEAQDWRALVATARDSIALEPLDEVPRAMIVQAYRAMGNEPLAVAEIRSYESVLQKELGIALPVELRALAMPVGSASARSSSRSFKRLSDG